MNDRLKRHAFFRLKDAGLDMDKRALSREPNLNVKKLKVLQDQYRLLNNAHGHAISDKMIAHFYKTMVNIGVRNDLQNDYRKSK